VPKAFKLTLCTESLDEITVAGELSDAELDSLNQYLHQYDELVQCRPMQEGFPCSTTVNWDKDLGLKVEAELPDRDTLSILLHRMRPFILQGEPSSYAKVAGILGRKLDSPILRRLLQEQRELYDGRKSQQLMRISSGDVLINSERVLSDWLNSHEYHRDPDKRKAIDDLFARMPGELMRAVLVSLVVDKIHAVRNMATIVAFVLGRNDKIKFAIHMKGLEKAPGGLTGSSS
jgi:hypothetical protein